MEVGSNVFLFSDLVERLRARRMLSGDSPREIMQLRKAVADAYRELPNHHNWKYYNRRIIFQSSATQTSTATYDHTGGAYERLVTIASGTLPSWLKYGFVSYNSNAYYVDRVIDTTRFTLRDGSNPGSDFTAQSIVLVRDSYPLPFTLRNINEVWCTSGARRLSYRSEANATGYSRLHSRYGTALHYMTRNSTATLGNVDFVLMPAQDAVATFEINAYICPRELRVYEESGTDGAAAGGSGVFTSTSANFTQKMVGCVLRVSPDGALPKSDTHFDETRSNWENQYVITKVTSATQLEVASTLTAMEDRGYTISEVADIHPSVHLGLLEIDAIRRFAQNNGVSKEDKMMVEQDFRTALRQAVAADSDINWTIEQANEMPWMYDFFKINIYAPHTF